MTNAEVVSGWIHAMNTHGYSPKLLQTKSLRADGVYLVSYATPIAKFTNGRFQLSGRKFSQTTSRHQGLVKHYVPCELLEIVDEIASPKEAYPWRW